MTIMTVEDLRTHLQWAIEVEHSTIPPYLYAYWSIKDQNSEVAQTIREVVVEEMLHMALACNILNAVGGHPSISHPSFVPSYPGPIPHHALHPPLVVHLQRASIDAIAGTFLAIERPETEGDPPQDDNFTTIGQLYDAIKVGFAFLGASVPQSAIFTGKSSLQVSGQDGFFPNAPIELFAVKDLTSAIKAIDEIVHQGEGTPQNMAPDGELAHYWRFNEIVDGKIPFPAGKVSPAEIDPSTTSLATGPVRGLSQLFNDCYGLLLRSLHHIFNGNATKYGPAMFTLMRDVLPPIARLLMTTPLPQRNRSQGFQLLITAGPAFEFSNPDQERAIEDCLALTSAFPKSSLTNVASQLGGLVAIPGGPIGNQPPG